jgi:hypothetical protein
MPKFINNAPPITDPRWKDWAAPVKEYLSEPRTWAQLLKWARETHLNGSLLRNCLAWLEHNRMAASTNKRPVVWYTGSCPAIRSTDLESDVEKVA